MAKRKKTAQGAGGWKKKKVDDKSQPNHISLPTPPPPPNNDPNTSPSLPIEVLRSILSHLRHDPEKTALARCMRVSTTFKELAASYLYERLDWKHVERNALRLNATGRGTKDKSKIASKDEVLKHIKSIEIAPHPSSTCPLNVNPSRQDLIVVPVLRIDNSKDEVSPYQSSNTCLAGRSCPFLKMLAPRKLLIFPDAEYRKIHFGRMNDEHLAECIIHVNIATMSQDSRLFESLPNSKRHVLILSTSNAMKGDEGSASVSTPGSQYDELSPHGSFMIFLRHLAISGRPVHLPWDVVIVMTVDARDLLDKPLTPKDERVLGRLLKTKYDMRVPIAATRKREQSDVDKLFKSLEAWSMRQYLASPDSQGVFTEDEIARMQEPNPTTSEMEEEA